jgi:hypothetical protein
VQQSVNGSLAGKANIVVHVSEVAATMIQFLNIFFQTY